MYNLQPLLCGRCVWSCQRKEVIRMHKTKKIRKWRICQILMGIGWLILCGIIVAMANTGLTVEDRDITPVLLFGSLGLYLIFTKKKIIY